jgi:hypothetical protein
MKHLIYRILTVLFLLFPVILAQAQRERNYIYMVESTPSMGKPENLGKSTRKWIYREIKALNEGSVTLIPYQDEPLTPISFDVKEASDNQIDGYLGKADKTIWKLMKKNGKANLYAALKDAVKHIDNKKDNFIYILSNSTNEQDEESICRFIRNWCTMKPDNVYVFYIMLTRNAYSQPVVDAINHCPDIFIIDAKGRSMKSICALMPREMVVNLQDIIENTPYQNQPPKIHSSVDGPYFLKIHSEDTLFYLNTSVRMNEYGSIRVTPQSPNTIEELLIGKNEYNFDVRVSVDTEKMWLVTDSLHIRVINKPERILYLPPQVFTHLKVRHYPRFLFWKANRPDTIHLFLNDQMNKEARLRNASALFMLLIKDIPDGDYRLLLDGHHLADKTFRLDSITNQTCLDIVFSDNVPAGSYQMVLQCLSSDNLDRINATPPDSYYQSQLVAFQIGHNPLAFLIILFCLLLFAMFSLLSITKNRKNGKA